MSFRYNPLTGQLDVVAPDNFSYDLIETDDVIEIPAKQQMCVAGRVVLEGTIVINGRLAIL